MVRLLGYHVYYLRHIGVVVVWSEARNSWYTVVYHGHIGVVVVKLVNTAAIRSKSCVSAYYGIPPACDLKITDSRQLHQPCLLAHQDVV